MKKWEELPPDMRVPEVRTFYEILKRRRGSLILKRIFDIIVAGFLLIVLSPVLVLLSVLIKADSKGPVFFRQVRVTRYGKTFRIFKFRTMVNNADKIGTQVTTKGDVRVTRIGKRLRGCRLDELPQLFNTLNGSMSLVGPRPPATYHPYDGYEAYPKKKKKRFMMRPGITGLAQATVRNSASWDERIRIDNQYIDSFNVWLDIKILFMTVMRVLKSENIYAPGQVEKSGEK